MTNDPRSGGTASHASHDPHLIAALAADDLPAAERATAQGVVATCTECAALAADLAAIARAVRDDLPTPRRRRDFRLSDADAQRLRGGSPFRRALARLGAPGFAILQPLGGVAAALGIALVVATSGILPLSGAGSLQMAGGAAAPEENRQLAASPAASADGAPNAPEATGGTTGVETFGGSAGPAGGPGPAGGEEGSPREGTDTGSGDGAEAALDQGIAEGDTLAPGLLAGALLFIVGLGAVLLRRLGTRLHQPR